MKIAVWHTGHQIADTVADAVFKSLSSDTFLIVTKHHVSDRFPKVNIHIGYGILRGMEDVFRKAEAAGKPWFNIDRGYFKPNHFGGYYRVSLKGTQHTQGNFNHFLALPNKKKKTPRLDALNIDVMQWHGVEPDKHFLVCPPTDYAIKFFNIDVNEWLNHARQAAYFLGFQKVIMRPKGTEKPLQSHLDKAGCVMTYNSAVGWEALRQGIPVISHPNSIIGATCKDIPLDKLGRFQSKCRHELFAVMSELQLTLSEMKQGLLWPLMGRLLSSSGTTLASRLVHTLPPTVSCGIQETQSA